MGFLGSKSSFVAFHLGLIAGFVSTYYLVGNLWWEGSARPSTHRRHGAKDPAWIVDRSALVSVAQPHLAGKDWRGSQDAIKQGRRTSVPPGVAWVTVPIRPGL